MFKWIFTFVILSQLVLANETTSSTVTVSPSGHSTTDPHQAKQVKVGSSTITVHEKKEPAAAVHHADPSEGVSPEVALGWLKNGNTRYLKHKLRKDGQSQIDRDRLANGQKPHTIVLSCSDSRVPPELLFDQKLGEIFVIRTAGESLDNSGIASIEYALEHLGSQLILVMGHSSCGAVKAALSTLKGGDAGSPALNYLVKDLHPHLSSFKDKEPSKYVKTESTINARGVAKDLVDRSKIIADKVTSGKLQIKTALYDIESGVVKFDQ